MSVAKALGATFVLAAATTVMVIDNGFQNTQAQEAMAHVAQQNYPVDHSLKDLEGKKIPYKSYGILGTFSTSLTISAVNKNTDGTFDIKGAVNGENGLENVFKLKGYDPKRPPMLYAETLPPEGPTGTN